LAEALLLILETVVLRRDGVQAGRQENDLGGEDRKFTIGAILGAGTARETDDTNNISSAQMLVLSLEGDIARGVLGLAHDLHLDTFGTDIVEEKLGT
jgi:hypothetical protein